MNRKRTTVIAVLLATIQLKESHADCREEYYPPNSSVIRSPNYGLEFGEPANCKWEFILNAEYALLLKLTNIHFPQTTQDDLRLCEKYNLNLKIQGVGDSTLCQKKVQEDNATCIVYYYEDDWWRDTTFARGCIEGGIYPSMVVAYQTDGGRPVANQSTNLIKGFEMKYEFVKTKKDYSIIWLIILGIAFILVVGKFSVKILQRSCYCCKCRKRNKKDDDILLSILNTPGAGAEFL